MLVSLLLGSVAASRRSLIILLISNLLYFCWFLWVYLSAFHFHPDPQAGIAFLFVGVYSLPVMIPLWIIAMCLRRSSQTQSEQDASSNP
jgi:predicted permease